jgi:recombination protein RecA
MNKPKEKVKKAASGAPIEDTLKAIRAKFGDESIMMLNNTRNVDIDVLPTGSIGLDWALGIGGYPRGRIIEVFGPESSGKTTLALHAIATAQSKGEECAFIDAEHAMDPQYAKRLGVRIDKLLISQPDNGEQGLQIVDALVRGGKMGVIVVDSVAALTPKSEIEGEIGEQKIGAQARLMSQAMRVLTSVIKKSDTIVIFINQTRVNLSAMATWGAPPETTSGGKALKFYASVRIEIKRIAYIKKSADADPIGGRVRCKVIKNKVAAPFKQTEFDVMFNEGISKEGELLALGEKHGLIKDFVWGEVKLGRGYESARQFLVEDGRVARDLEKAVRKAMREQE